MSKKPALSLKNKKREDIQSVLFEKMYLQIRDILNWQYRRKKKKGMLAEDVEKKAFSYSSELSHIRQGNLYLPKDHKNTDSLPLIIDIHGGGWIYGDKDLYDDYSSRLVQKGNIVSSLTYRTIDYASLFDQVQDIFAYLHHLKDHHEEYNISLDTIMLTGDSAGAQLSLLCYTINQDERLQKIFKVKPVDLNFSCIALTHPVCFIDQAGQIPNQEWLSRELTIPGLQTMLYGKEFENKEIYQNSANPSLYIHKDIEFPPIMLVTSEGDILFKYQTFLLADFFNKMNINYELFVEKDKGAQHVYNVSNPMHDLAEKCNEAMMNFFRQSLSNKGTEENYVQS